MADYIKRSDVMSICESYSQHCFETSDSRGQDIADRILDDVCVMPVADVEEVKHGKWKEHFAFDCWHYDCPFCDDGYATKEKDKTPPNYCPNCGAKMDGERRDT